MSRNAKGIIGWFVLSVLFGLLCLPIMIAREVYQWKHYNLPKFEWDDIWRYGSVILGGSIVHYLILALIL